MVYVPPSCRSSVFPFREELCQFDTIPLYRFRRVFSRSCLSMLFRTARPCCVVVGVSSRRIRMVAAKSALFRESKSLPTCLHSARSCCSSAEPSKDFALSMDCRTRSMAEPSDVVSSVIWAVRISFRIADSSS